MRGIRLIPSGLKLDFLRHKIVGTVVSAVIVFGALGLIATKGLNFGIDFTGGMMIEVQVEPAPDLSLIRQDLNDLNIGDIAIQ
jgi:preprotein translocase subunit SecF